MLEGASILITGGTGSFGKAFVKTILERFPTIRRLVIFSRDEMKQYEMSKEFSEVNYKSIRYFLGDVRQVERLKQALQDIDIVIHAAALKQVPAAEYNPFEFINTNILGAENLIRACLNSKVKKVIALSTDKAAAPINLYGATKLCSDKLFIAANNIRGSRDIIFSVVRYGNVMGSRGSVIPFFLEKSKSGILPITHNDMTRFNITMTEAIEMVIWAIEKAVGGEIFVPKIPSYKLSDLAKAIAPDAIHKVIGIRPGEKMHEEMITSSDSMQTVNLEKYYVILPYMSPQKKDKYCKLNNAKLVDPNFTYNSNTNEKMLTIKELRKLIKDNIG